MINRKMGHLTSAGDLVQRGMRRSRPLQLFLAARLYGGSAEEISERGEAVLEALAAACPDRSPPLNWNFAAASLLENPSRRLHNLIVEIKARRGPRGDRLLPAGFAGAAHPELQQDELDRELAWCFRNPWFSALAAVFGEPPAAVLPFRADPLREAATGAYSAAGFRLLAVPVRLAALASMASLARLWGLGEGRCSLLPAVALRGAAEAAALVRAAGSVGGPEARLMVLLDPPEPGDRDGLRELLRLLLAGLGHGRSLSFPPLEELCAELPPAGAPALSAIALAAEAGGPGRSALTRAQRLRTSRRRSGAEVRSLLEALRCLPAPGSRGGRVAAAEARGPSRLLSGGPAARGRRAEMVMSASMTGLVTLSGARYDAVFAEGRLSGFCRAGKPILGTGPARCYVCLAAEVVDLQTESAFSFERGPQRGVHTELTATLAPASSSLRLHVDSYFREGEDPLTIEMSLEFSDPADARRLTALVPLELSIGDAGTALRCELPGGGVYREQLSVPEGLVYGHRVWVCTGEAELAIESPGGSTALQFRRQGARRPLLRLNLGGTYALRPEAWPALLTGPIALRLGVALR